MKNLNLAVLSLVAGLITNQAGAESIQRTMQMKATAQLDKITLIDGQAYLELEQVIKANPFLELDIVYRTHNENDKGYVTLILKKSIGDEATDKVRLDIEYVKINRCGGIEVYAIDDMRSDGGGLTTVRIVSQSLICGGPVPVNTSITTLEINDHLRPNGNEERQESNKIRYKITYKGSNLVHVY